MPDDASFGFGLSYSKFVYGDVKLDKTETDFQGSITASVTVTNSSEQLNNHFELKIISECKMNKNQKYIAVIGIILIAITLFYWYSQGAEVFTKTQVLIDKTTDLDRMLGVENKEYVDQFVFGLLPSGMSSIMEIISTASIAGVVVILSGILIYLFRNKRKEKK